MNFITITVTVSGRNFRPGSRILTAFRLGEKKRYEPHEEYITSALHWTDKYIALFTNVLFYTFLPDQFCTLKLCEYL